MVADFGEMPLPRKDSVLALRVPVPGSCTMAKISPPSPHISGITTAATAAAAIAASTALPPSCRTANPADTVKGWAAATMPFDAYTGARRRRDQGCGAVIFPGNPIIRRQLLFNVGRFNAAA